LEKIQRPSRVEPAIQFFHKLFFFLRRAFVHWRLCCRLEAWLFSVLFMAREKPNHWQAKIFENLCGAFAFI
jgi:hypothetical protein